MNWTEFKNIFEDTEVVGEKLVIKSDLEKDSYH